MEQRNHHYLGWAVTVFLTVCAILLFYDTLFGRRVLPALWGQFLTAIAPILYGAFFAYLLAPVVNFFERLFPNTSREKGKRGAFLRSCSVALTWIVICGLIYLLFSVLLPELYASLLQLAGSMESYYATITGWMERLLDVYPTIEEWVTDQMNEFYQDITGWLRSDALPQVQAMMAAAAGGVVSAVNFFKNLLIGVIVSVYLLYAKERCAAYARKLCYSLFPRDKVHWILRGSKRADSIFSGFVRGKLLDSAIIGVLCFIGCTIFKFPYTPLVSVFVGVTNIIPFFGPFLGAVPSVFLILLVSPIKALYFLIFVLVLQQLDGNVIGPLILGDRTGLSSLWVIIAILVGGSFFGILGMFFGVPVCGCLFSFVNFLVDMRLGKKRLPVALESYAQELSEPPAKTPPAGEKK